MTLKTKLLEAVTEVVESCDDNCSDCEFLSLCDNIDRLVDITHIKQILED